MGKWPKILPPLTDEQKLISDDFMKLWHEVLPAKFGIVDRFNHQYVASASGSAFRRTLEVGAGLGEHLRYETLTPQQEAEYVAMDIRQNMIDCLAAGYPKVKAVVGDIQGRLDFPDGHFDRILAIHVLEHLPDLPKAVREIRRLCAPGGRLHVVIPCEGGLSYSLARRVSAQRVFEKRYKQPYKWFIEREHLNKPDEIVEELSPFFRLLRRSCFPVPILPVTLNLVIGMTLEPS